MPKPVDFTRPRQLADCRILVVGVGSNDTRWAATIGKLLEPVCNGVTVLSGLARVVTESARHDVVVIMFYHEQKFTPNQLTQAMRRTNPYLNVVVVTDDPESYVARRGGLEDLALSAPKISHAKDESALAAALFSPLKSMLALPLRVPQSIRA